MLFPSLSPDKFRVNHQMLLSGIEGTNGAAGEAFPGKSGGFKLKDSPQGGAENLLSGVFYIYFPFKNIKFMLVFLAWFFLTLSYSILYLLGFFLYKKSV